jgi:hypothetical protein
MASMDTSKDERVPSLHDEAKREKREPQPSVRLLLGQFGGVSDDSDDDEVEYVVKKHQRPEMLSAKMK